MYSRSNSRCQFSGIRHTLKPNKTLMYQESLGFREGKESRANRFLSEGSGATSGPKRTEFCRAVR